jgi:DNA-binding transcriptional regulator LsrR (DeoR family)
MPRSTRWHPSQESDELIYAVCERFFDQIGKQFSVESGNERERRGAAASVAEWLKEEWGRNDLSREKIYPLFWEAARRDFLFLQPPREKKIAEKIVNKYQLDQHGGEVHVINVRGPSSPRHVTSAAADLVVSLVEKLSRQKNRDRKPEEPIKPVHIGMGAGFATMLVAKRMGRKIASEDECPSLVLHAISAGGFLVNEPHKSPTTYFSFFEESLSNIDYVALFSETVVSNEDYEKIQKNPSVRRSFDRKHEIDIIVTSLAAADHEHGLLVRFLTHLVEEGLLEQDVLDQMQRAGWKGDVQFRPYSDTGPLADICPVRAVTLFELEELVALAKKKEKHVILVAGPCGECGASKTDALKPLLACPDLQLWTHLVTDAQTAKGLL